MNGSTTVLSSAGTNGTITVAAETQPVPPKTEPMEVDKAVSKEENSVEMADESEDGGRGKLQAVVKPQIIRHIIDGFMIEEAAEAFPVSAFLGNLPKIAAVCEDCVQINTVFTRLQGAPFCPKIEHQNKWCLVHAYEITIILI